MQLDPIKTSIIQSIDAISDTCYKVVTKNSIYIVMVK